MPYKKARYTHHRQRKPELFIQKSFRNVPLSHTGYRGKKFKVRGARAIVGKLRKTGKWETQSILIPKKRRR